MANILTASEAAAVLRCDSTDAGMLALLPLVDAYIRNATGKDWTVDTPIAPEAKSAARMLLVKWHEDPGMFSAASGLAGGGLSFGLSAVLTQLESLALRYRVFTGRDGAGGITVAGVSAGDSVDSLIGIIGVSGDQTANFEAVISVDDQIQQISTSDLSEKMYRAYLIPPEAL